MNWKSLETRKKLRGGYYTPPALARWLARWALERGARRVLEPGCGDGAFLDALAAESRRPGAGPLEVDALELDPAEAAKARACAPGRGRVTVHEGCAFEWIAARPRARWDAVVGNPPYVRYQYFEPAQRVLAERLCAASGVPISKLTNAWVPFVVFSVERLAPGGRLAMVVPAELMHVIHADGLRRFLERAGRRLSLVHLRERPFAGALQGVLLLLFEKAAPGEGPAAPRILDVEDVASLPDPAGLDADERPGTAGGRWMRGLLEPDERALLESIEAAGWAPPFGAVASVEVGIVTGANDFFVADRATVDEHGLAPWTVPMLGRSEQVRGVRYTRADHDANARDGRRVAFVRLPAREDRLSAGARRYLALGEERGLPARYKCRIREPWWDVPYVWRAPVALLKRCHGHPRLVLNEARAFSTDTAYRIAPRPGVAARDLVGSFYSSLTFLAAELEGRHYGGGVLELVPSEIARLPVPLASFSAGQLRSLDEGVRRDDARLLDAQDRRLLGGRLSAGEVRLLRRAWERLRDRRLRVKAR